MNTTANQFRDFVAEYYGGEEAAAVLLLGAADTIERLTRERDTILRWSIRHAGHIGTRSDDGRGCWWARGDGGIVFATTAEDVIRKAAGLGPEETNP